MKWGYLVLSLLMSSFFYRCANQTTPGGGPKDSIPPILQTSIPANNQKNFKGKVLTLTFDEAVKIKDQKEIIITPTPGKNVLIQAKQKNVTIEPKEGWKDSTTYSISFREAIQDITESNAARNLHLAFSTGPVIDSLTISGRIHLVLKETIPERITVAIYQSDTFNIFKHPPVYFTETTKEGDFKIANLKPGRYRIFAFEDKNKNLKVDSQTELYGLSSDTLNLTTDLPKLNLYLLRVDSRKLKVNNVRHNLKLSKIRLSKFITAYNLVPLPGQNFLNTYGDNQSEINVYHPQGMVDSTSVTLTATDSLNQKLDTTLIIKASDVKTLKETFKISITKASLSSETGLLKALITYNIPLKKISVDTMLIMVDSANSIKLSPTDFQVDTAQKQATFICALDKKFLAETTETPTIFISRGVFISIEDDSSKAIKYPVRYLKPEETAKLAIDVKTNKPHYIIQLLTKDYSVVQAVRNQPKMTFTNLAPDEYKIRAVIDTNNNGKWDAGNIYRNTEPEKIIYYRNPDKKYETPLRANWEVGPLLFRF